MPRPDSAESAGAIWRAAATHDGSRAPEPSPSGEKSPPPNSQYEPDDQAGGAE